MAELANYHQYNGYHWSTGSMRNALEYRGVKAPHTGQPFSEAMLMGIAGGITFGYFYFNYQGHDPQVNILTRNTFNNYGWDAIAKRLGLSQDVIHSTSADKARDKLIASLEEGEAPVVWADVFTLGYEYSELGTDMWMSIPVVVSGYDSSTGEARLADRARSPILTTTDTLDRARHRIKKDKARIVVLEPPTEDKLATAVAAGLNDCIQLFTEKPPKGSANNFGLNGMRRWNEMMTGTPTKTSWEALYSTGRDMASALSTAFKYSLLNCKDESLTAEREMFADFLLEAADVLGKKSLYGVADRFRESGTLWRQLAEVLLPDDNEVLAAAKTCLVRRHREFLEHGNAHIDTLSKLDNEYEALLESADGTVPAGGEARELLSRIAGVVEQILTVETAAIEEMRRELG